MCWRLNLAYTSYVTFCYFIYIYIHVFILCCAHKNIKTIFSFVNLIYFLDKALAIYLYFFSRKGNLNLFETLHLTMQKKKSEFNGRYFFDEHLKHWNWKICWRWFSLKYWKKLCIEYIYKTKKMKKMNE